MLVDVELFELVDSVFRFEDDFMASEVVVDSMIVLLLSCDSNVLSIPELEGPVEVSDPFCLKAVEVTKTAGVKESTVDVVAILGLDTWRLVVIL